MNTLPTVAAALVALATGAGTADVPRDPVATVEGYIAASDADDSERMWEYLADDSRIWFDKREGPGRPRSRTTGKGPWAQWDDFFNASSTHVGKWSAAGDSVSGLFEEINDFYRLCERGPSRLRIIYFLDGDGLISGTLIQPVSSSPGRYDEAEAWIAEHYPEDHARLVVDGDIVPGLENAKRWKVLLTQWRESVGLPPIE
jgi:hypothetical protein